MQSEELLNIAEGCGRYEARYTDRSQRNFPAIANGSLWEFISWLDVALIDKACDVTKLQELRNMSEHLSNLIIEEATQPRYRGIEV